MPPVPPIRVRVEALEDALGPLQHRITHQERDLTLLLHARDLLERALGDALERLADTERRLGVLEGHPPPRRLVLVPLEAAGDV